MSEQKMPASQTAGLLASAAALFALGLVVGLIFTFEAIGHVAVWPFLPAIDWQMPGDEAAWRRAHLGLLLNSLALMMFALAGTQLRLSQAGQHWYRLCVLITAWSNSLGFIVGAVFGVRGLEFGAPWTNSLNYLLFFIAVPTAFIQALLLWRGAMAARQESGA